MSPSNQTSSVRNYLEQDVAGKSPGELLLLLYETGQRACKRRDRQLAIGVLVELMGGVNVECGDLATGLIRLYDYALREVRENRYEFAENLMRELGEAYRDAGQASSGVSEAAA